MTLITSELRITCASLSFGEFSAEYTGTWDNFGHDDLPKKEITWSRYGMDVQYFFMGSSI